MNVILKKLYDLLSAEASVENQFTSKEIIRREDRFLKNYFPNEDTYMQAENDLNLLQDMYQQKAFEAGFYTAVRLFIR